MLLGVQSVCQSIVVDRVCRRERKKGEKEGVLVVLLSWGGGFRIHISTGDEYGDGAWGVEREAWSAERRTQSRGEVSRVEQSRAEQSRVE